MSAIEEVAKLLELSTLTRRFLGVLAENRRLAETGRVIRAFREIAAAQRGEVSAEVISARPLTEDQLSSLKQKLTARSSLFCLCLASDRYRYMYYQYP